jgi:hypothetical protein
MEHEQRLQTFASKNKYEERTRFFFKTGRRNGQLADLDGPPSMLNAQQR